MKRLLIAEGFKHIKNINIKKIEKHILSSSLSFLTVRFQSPFTQLFYREIGMEELELQ